MRHLPLLGGPNAILSPRHGAPLAEERTDHDHQVCDSAFCRADFDDSAWASVDLPHDWSSLDLPDRNDDESTPTLALRYGAWRFSTGDDAAWSAPGFDDSSWQRVKGGQDWRVHSNYTARNATGWYRQHFSVPEFMINASAWNPNQLLASLGIISGSDEA